MAASFSLNVVGLFERGEAARALANQVSAVTVACAGTPGFFRPRLPNPWFHPPGTIEATSYYDTRPLKATLERFVDFDRVNSDKCETRLSLGAVNVRSGNLVYFNPGTQVIGPEHVMASGALPPGFPAIEIEAEPAERDDLVSKVHAPRISQAREAMRTPGLSQLAMTG